MKLKEYRIPMPLTLDEYRLGQQWTEMELLKETLQTSSTSVTIYNHTTERERLEIINDKVPLILQTNVTSSTFITRKKYHIKDQKSKLFDLFFFKSKTDLILEEYSWDKWPYTLTIIENLDNCIRIIIQSYYQDTCHSPINPHSHLYFSLNNEQMKDLKDYEIINIAERFDNTKKDYRIDEDPTRNISLKKPTLLPLQINSKWYEHLSKTHSSMCVYKLMELIIFNEEKSLLTKATNKILWSSIMKTQKMLYHRFHQKMICNIDQWIDRTRENIREEEKLVEKYLVQQQQQQQQRQLMDLTK